MAIGDVYRLSARWQRGGSGDDAVNVWHFNQETDPAPGLTPAVDLIQAFMSEAIEDYANCVNLGYKLDLLSVRQVEGGMEVAELVVDQDGLRGTLETALASQLTCVVSWRSGLAGRRRRGRTFMPPASEGDLSFGVWDSIYRDAVSLFATALFTGMSTPTAEHGGWRLGIWSTVAGAGVFTPVTNWLVNQNPGIMRSRKLGSGS